MRKDDRNGTGNKYNVGLRSNVLLARYTGTGGNINRDLFCMAGKSEKGFGYVGVGSIVV